MEKFRLDVVNKTLTISKGFADAVAAGEGEEYEFYTRLMNQIPGLNVVRQTHRTPSSYTTKGGEKFSCNQFKNLTYENMERFMAALPDNEGYFTEYNFVRNAAAGIQTSGYALVRKWFVAQFPEYRSNPLMYLHNKPAVLPGIAIVEQESTTQKKSA